MMDLKSDPGWVAFYGLMQVNTRLLERIGAEVEAETGHPQAWLEVLVNLKGAGGRMRMSDLADALLLSRGGATRLVARIEASGLVQREIPPSDRRATYAVLTPAGREAAEAALPVHLDAVRRTFAQHLDDAEVQTLLRVFVRVLHANGIPCGMLEQLLASDCPVNQE